MKNQYPNDGKRHPDLSDLWHEIVEAARPLGASTSFYLWVFAVVALMSYPDWRAIVGWGFVLFGLWGILFLHSRFRSSRK